MDWLGGVRNFLKDRSSKDAGEAAPTAAEPTAAEPAGSVPTAAVPVRSPKPAPPSADGWTPADDKHLRMAVANTQGSLQDFWKEADYWDMVLNSAAAVEGDFGHTAEEAAARYGQLTRCSFQATQFIQFGGVTAGGGLAESTSKDLARGIRFATGC